MKAITYTQYGPPENLSLSEIPKPIPKPDEVLIKVKATSLNSSDHEMLKGSPSYIRMWGLFKPKYQILGSDVAGEIQSIGANVKSFKPGQRVVTDLMERWGGLAEYVCAKTNILVTIPDQLSYTEAASMPQAAVVALQALSVYGPLKPDHEILINGAGGGAGSFAIQIAKMSNAQVTAVDSAEKLEFMTSLGADIVLDYSTTNFTRGHSKYDLIVDFVSPYPASQCKNVLKRNGGYVTVGGSTKRIIQALFLGGLTALYGKKKVKLLVHKQNNKDITKIMNLIISKDITPQIDKIFSLEESVLAFKYLSAGRAKGKVIISI